MGIVITQGPCPYPHCTHASKGYVEYDDGGFHCFSCGKHGNGNGYIGLESRIRLDKESTAESTYPPLPDDVFPLAQSADGSNPLGKKALNWVLKYGLTFAEIEQNSFLWSETKQYLIFPVFDKANLLMWQARYFGTNKKHPKYITNGPARDSMHTLSQEGIQGIVLVEDLISAIKVSRVITAMPLWGSQLSSITLQRVQLTGHSPIYLWLDYDKKEKAIEWAGHSNYLRPIITLLDPKCYTTEEIQAILND